MNRKFFQKLVLASALLALAVPGIGFADQKDCKDDKNKFCADVQMGGGRIIKCLNDHSKDLSDKCREFVNQKLQEQKGN